MEVLEVKNVRIPDNVVTVHLSKMDIKYLSVQLGKFLFFDRCDKVFYLFNDNVVYYALLEGENDE